MQFQTNSPLLVDDFDRNSICQMKKLSAFKLEFNWQQSHKRLHLHFQCELKTTSVILITVLIFLLVIIRRFSFFSTHFLLLFFLSFFLPSLLQRQFLIHFIITLAVAILLYLLKKTRKKTKRMCVYICQAFAYDQDWFDISTFNTFV